ncbi:MAG TPA: Yip1 family protein [Gemmatimonadales bacterium]|nr:Yip1 family protein [Gemmatimonadales bacterium]
MKPGAPRPRPALKLPAWLERARRLILHPTQAWPAIAGEFTTVGPIYARFLVPMAAIGPLATTLGTIVFGERSILGQTYEMSFKNAVTDGILQYVLGLVAVYGVALVIDALAPTFSGQRNQVQALKLAAYGSTPFWLSGVFALVPKLTILGLVVGLYTFRLFALGLPLLMKAPREKTPGYAVVVAVAAILVALLCAALEVKIVV